MLRSVGFRAACRSRARSWAESLGGAGRSYVCRFSHATRSNADHLRERAGSLRDAGDVRCRARGSSSAPLRSVSTTRRMKGRRKRVAVLPRVPRRSERRDPSIALDGEKPVRSQSSETLRERRRRDAVPRLHLVTRQQEPLAERQPDQQHGRARQIESAMPLGAPIRIWQLEVGRAPLPRMSVVGPTASVVAKKRHAHEPTVPLAANEVLAFKPRPVLRNGRARTRSLRIHVHRASPYARITGDVEGPAARHRMKQQVLLQRREPPRAHECAQRTGHHLAVLPSLLDKRPLERERVTIGQLQESFDSLLRCRRCTSHELKYGSPVC